MFSNRKEDKVIPIIQFENFDITVTCKKCGSTNVLLEFQYGQSAAIVDVQCHEQGCINHDSLEDER